MIAGSFVGWKVCALMEKTSADGGILGIGNLRTGSAGGAGARHGHRWVVG